MARTIPIIQLHENLLVSIQIELHDAVVIELKENIAEEILRKRVSGLIVELSGMDTFDSYIACAIRDIAHIGRLMGVRTVVAGFDAAIATTLVEMGIRMDGVDTAVSLEAALEILTADQREHRQLGEMALREIGIFDEVPLDADTSQPPSGPESLADSPNSVGRLEVSNNHGVLGSPKSALDEFGHFLESTS